MSVIDNGPGIPDHAQLTVRRRWQQGAAGQVMQEGAGLGLAIVAEYARLMQAQLSMDNLPADAGFQVNVLFLNAQPASP